MKKEGVSPDGYIPGTTVHEYLVNFAKDYDLTCRTRLKTTVSRVTRALEGRGWTLEISGGQNINCDKLIYATGPTSSAIVPSWPQEGFVSPIIHSQQLGVHLDHIQNNVQRATVVGAAKSSYDTVFMLLKAGKKVDWIMRDSPSGPLSISAPTFIGLWNTVDHVSTRMAASFSPSIMNTSGFWYSFLQRTMVGRALTKVYWRTSTYLSAAHAGYSKSEDAEKLRPKPYGYGFVSPFPRCRHLWLLILLQYVLGERRHRYRECARLLESVSRWERHSTPHRDRNLFTSRCRQPAERPLCRY